MRSKKLTKLSAILLGASLTVGVLGIATACGEEAHDHTFATEWTKTEYEHYYAATCEHSTEKKDVGGHRLVDGTCSVCGYTKDAVASYAYEEVEGGIAITAYTGDPMDEITIPATIDGKKVVAIADDALTILNEDPEARLDSLKQVKTIKFEAEIKTVGKRNFSRMNSLKSVVLPDSVTKVDTGCFYSNPQLTTLKVPNGYVVLGTETLQACPKLDTIQLPETLSPADSTVFKGLANDIDIIYGGSKSEWMASTYKAKSRLTNANVTYYGGAEVTTEEDGGFVYKLNADNNSYSIVGLTADIISETSTEINLPLTYKEKNVTALGSAVFNINAYDATEDAELIAYLKTVTAVDVNSALAA
ncbi:MAG: leucine-rich repeat domain-containing protein [Clostridiales bacterium]|nr:leucine-rich repeat domain-containing protein [Clostridiales bacterium]